MIRSSFKRQAANPTRLGFTLIEMLVVIAILGITGTLALAVVNVVNEGDRFPSSVRSIQAALSGARDRALRTRLPRGVRFFVEPLGGDNTKMVITSMAYIGASEPWREGDVTFSSTAGNQLTAWTGTPGPNEPAARVTNWGQLYKTRQLTNSTRIRIPHDEEWYTVLTNGFLGVDGKPGADGTDDDGDGFTDFLDPPFNTIPDQDEFGMNTNDDDHFAPLLLTKAFSPGTAPTTRMLDADDIADYLLELGPAILPEEEPIRLSSGVAISLVDGYSGIGTGAATSGYESNLSSLHASTNYIDILYSAKGTLAGRLEPNGQVLPTGQVVYFYLADVQDIINNVDPGSDEAIDKRLVGVYTQSGSMQSFPVGPTGDILKFARTGTTSAQ
jgi:prepilin-type N-terminal cleavage/methylation domain-containing protein